MAIPVLIAFALPAAAAVIYVTFRPLWRNTVGPSAARMHARGWSKRGCRA